MSEERVQGDYTSWQNVLIQDGLCAHYVRLLLIQDWLH